MKLKRTSAKSFVIALSLVLVFLGATWAAERYYKSTNPLIFSNHSGQHWSRPWNHWDYVAIPAGVLGATFVVVGFMFLHKDD